MKRPFATSASTAPLICILFVCLLAFEEAHAVDISDVPLEAAIVTAPPVVMYVFDNSGSMDLEFLTDETQGLFQGAYYLFPDAAYSPEPEHGLGPGHALSATERRRWHSQWAGYNRLYYSPRQSYTPWPATRNHTFAQADLHHPSSNPVRLQGTNPSLAMAGVFFSVRYGREQIVVANAHYFTFHDADGSGRLDRGETVYLVTWADDDRDGLLDLDKTGGTDGRRYYRLEDDGDGLVEDGELIPVSDASEKKLIRPVDRDRHDLTDREELQNFVNWFSYYRRRVLTAKAVTAQAIYNSGRMYVGLYAVNAGPRISVRLLEGSAPRTGVITGEDPAVELLDALYAIESKGNTPLRLALNQVGRYLQTDSPSALGVSPLRWSGGQGCQRACAVVVSDGFWNDGFSGAGNADGDKGRPYADDWSDTLADIAMAYYEADLGPDLPDTVPVTRCDGAARQHMNTYALAPGLGDGAAGYAANFGSLPPAACLSDDPSVDGNWRQLPDDPGVEGGSHAPEQPFSPPGLLGAVAREGLRHAALNGHGRFFDTGLLQDVALGLPQSLDIANTSVNATDVVVNGMAISADTRAYQVSYRAGSWSGQVTAHGLNVGTGPKGVVLGPPLWRAADLLPGDANGIGEQRRIITYGGRWQEPRGVEFRYDRLSDGQKAALGSDLASGSNADERAAAIVDYIRGEPLVDGRARETLLGDIVYSTPVLVGRTLFVGANDGMLHAFDVESGAERFAYTPHLTVDHLPTLAQIDYADRHRCYVDGPLHAGEVVVGEFRRMTYLTGGLGKGGKGYFCLLAGSRERPLIDGAFAEYRWVFHVDDLGAGDPEYRIAELVRWEYPRPDASVDEMDNDGDGMVDEPGEFDPNMGYSFGAAYAVNANCPKESYRPVVIFGNGYNSHRRQALLYVLDAERGTLVRVIDTGAGGDNGLSTPALIDANLDRRVDYAYAGDLNGNLWKFDLTDEDPEKWGVAYGADHNADGVIDAADGDEPVPLFQTQGQPITGRPDVMVMHGGCEAQAHGYMVFFGTGRYLGAPDRYDASQQSLYGIWDYGDDSDDGEYLGRLTDRSSGRLSSGLYLVPKQVVEESAVDGTPTRRLDSDVLAYDMAKDGEDSDGIAANNDSAVREDNPARIAGWFLDFPTAGENPEASAERTVGDVTIRDGKIVVASYIPDSRPCGGGGRSWLYLLTACTGDSPSASMDEPLLSRGYPGKISHRPVIVKDMAHPRRDLILFGDSTGEIQGLEMAGENWGKVYWWQSR
jgi:type IV pilus assembly protein PilY1